MRFRRPLFFLLVFLLVATRAFARPGGGGSFSGGGGGGGSDDGIELFFDILFLVVELAVDYPDIGIPLIAIVVIVGVGWLAVITEGAARMLFGLLAVGGLVAGFVWIPYFLMITVGLVVLIAIITVANGKQMPEWSTQTKPQKSSPYKKVVANDPEFSAVLFDDFVYALYAEVQRARGAQGLGQLTPYLSQQVRAQLANPELKAVGDVVIGAMRIVSSSNKNDATSVVLEIESNFSEDARSFYQKERWTLRRLDGAKSRPPERVSSFHCPNCGSPLDPEQSSKCRACNEIIDTGRFDWRVEAISVLSRSERGPILTEDVQEVGTDLPTVVDPQLKEMLAQLSVADPDFNMKGLEKRVQLIFDTFQTAWAARDLKTMRPFLSDRLFVAQQYWVNAYKKAGLRNVTERTTISRIEPAKVTTDRYYDAVTLRVRARGLDYTLDAADKVVTGSKTTPRKYTEYWTLIRSAAKTGPAGDTLTCPNCAAPLDINMAGVCNACSAKVTSGQFDWVLSRIEQDEVYQG